MMRKLILKKAYEMEMTQAPIPEPADDQVRIHVKKSAEEGSSMNRSPSRCSSVSLQTMI